MNKLQSIEKIASKERSSDYSIRESDSDVYKIGNMCYKHYFGLSKKIVEQYHAFQNWLSASNVTIKMNNYNSLSPIHIQLNKLLENEPDTMVVINEVSFEPLYLGENNISTASDIESESEIVVTELPFIEGKTLFDVCMENQDNYDLLEYIYNLMVEINRLYSITYNLNMTADNPMDKFQIHGINCKIIGYNEGKLTVIITDTGRNINEIITKNNEKIHQIITGNKKQLSVYS